jgi:hypothetical protein
LDEALDFFGKGIPNLADPDIFAKYTNHLLSSLGQSGTDAPQVLAYERDLNFPEVAARFRMIEDSGVPVVADYGDAWERVLELRRNGPSRHGLRRLQRFTVSLQPQEIARLQRLGVLEPLLYNCDDSRPTTSWALKAKGAGVYDERFGFAWQGGERVEPENFIVG